MKKYLILAETEGVGYFVEIVGDYDMAVARENLFFQLAFNPPFDRQKLREEFNVLGTYQYINPFVSIKESIGGSSNGSSSTFLLEIDDSFDFKSFESYRNNYGTKK